MCDCILGMFYLSLKTRKTLLRQKSIKLSLMAQKKKSESSTTGSCSIDAVTDVRKRTSSLRVQSAKREGIFFYCYLLISSR